jgi:hypothetical protein
MKLEELMEGEYYKLAGTCSELAGYDRKNETPMKIPGVKRSGIGIITEFPGIPTGLTNQV